MPLHFDRPELNIYKQYGCGLFGTWIPRGWSSIGRVSNTDTHEPNNQLWTMDSAISLS